MKLATYLSVLIFLAVVHPAIAQQGTGTIVVVRVLPDHAVVAADSKVIFPGPGKPIPRYDICKILTFDNKYVFAAVGYTARYDPNHFRSGGTVWNVRDITKQLYQQGNVFGVDDFARQWAKKMLVVLSEDSKISAPLKSPDGIILVGFFISSSNGLTSGDVVVFRLKADGSIAARMTPAVASEQPQTAGDDDVILEFEANKTPRAKDWHSRIDKMESDDQIMALAKLEKQFDTSGAVGGPIDAVRITAKGIEWLDEKPSCKALNK
jgi:hypothetical protein